MLSDDFDQTSDFVYEVWNYNVDGDPLMGVFDDKAEAGEFAMDQTIETGGGLMSYYPPIERYSDLDPHERALALLSEVIVLAKDIREDLGEEYLVDTDILHTLVDEELPAMDVDPEYDREEFELIIDEIAWTDTALDLARIYRTLARIRHLGVYDGAALLTSELVFRDLFEEVNESAYEEGE